MKALAPNEMISLVSDLNAFADRAENLIDATQTNQKKNKNLLQRKQSDALSSLENDYRGSRDSIQNMSDQIIADAEGILKEIEDLDGRLSLMDKYYKKTKRKKEALPADTKSKTYDEATDYFETLEKIRDSFYALYRRYSEHILPGLLNGLHYLFSSRRKKDYEELIILKNVATNLCDELEETLLPLTDEKLETLEEEFFNRRNEMLEKQKKETASLEKDYSVTLEKVADEICADLDHVLPGAFVDSLWEMVTNYANAVDKVNASSEIQDEVLNMWYVDYPVDFFVRSRIVAAIIKEKCSKLLAENSVRLPIMTPVRNAPVWMIIADNSNRSAAQAFTHAMMYAMLSSCPVEKLIYTVVDPENRGNSIFPFFDAKKKLPEMFDEKIYIGKDEIYAKIKKINEKIENTLQDRLGNQYDTIFDYAKDTPDYDLTVELVMLYDFPKGFDERTLVELRNILRNGSKCGIYTVISYLPNSDDTRSKEYEQSLQTIVRLSSVIRQNGESFVLRGLPLAYYPMPEKNAFAKFFSKYMLIFEGIKNRGIAFSPLLRKLIEARDSLELDAHITHICDMMKEYEKTYAHVPEINATFPSLVTLGNVLYPADVFSDSIGYQQIMDRFGVEHRAETQNSSFVELPLTFDLGNSFNLFLHCPEENSKYMLAFTHHVIWSFLSFLPVTKVNICVFDSNQRGNSILPFLDFRKRSAETFDQKIYTNQEQIYDRLQKINAQIDEFIQEKLRNRYRDILDYNRNTPRRAEPVTLLVLYDFPSGMEERSADLLINILRNGNRCGVFTMICYNPNIPFSRYGNMEERLEQISKYCSSIEYRNGHYSLLPYHLQIKVPRSLSYDDVNAFVEDYVAKCETVKKQGLSFKDILSKDLFSLDSSKSLKIPIGIGDGDSIVKIVIGEGSSHHGLIAGATGSGKSTLLHTLIMSGMLHYSPDQLHLYLMDFKSGTEFKIYESVKLPHIQLLALDAMQEFGESILENLVAEMEHRGSLFKETGQTSLKGYVQATGQPLPRIMVIMDEFQILFNDSTNRKVAMNCAELTKRIVTEGRAFGIHLFMATQSTKVISDLTLSRGTIEQMRIRIGLKCGEDDARYLFSDQNDLKALTMMKGPIGTAVMNLDYTEQSNIGFRAAYCDDATQKYYLDFISKTFAEQPSTLQTFEGSRTTNLLDYFASTDVHETSDLPVQIHMGTLIKVAPPFKISIDKKKKHNLLICGSNESMADTVSNNYIISALLNRNARVYCIDGNKLVGDDESGGFYEALCACSTRFQVAEDRGDIIRFIHEIYSNYQSWKKQNDAQVIFVVIKNLQFLDIVMSMFQGERVDESEFMETAEPEITDPLAALNAIANFSVGKGSEDSMPVGEQLIKLVEDGSGYGIHFVVTSLEYQPVKESMYYGENLLARFPERIIFSLGESDADNLIENVSVAGLRNNTVYFTDGVKNTFQMKPYITPSSSELKKLFRETDISIRG